MVSFNDQIRDGEVFEKGRRAEEVANFYLKLNGFFTLANFALHKDRRALDLSTEADLLAIRLKHSCEHVGGRKLNPCNRLSRILVHTDLSAFLIVEVKATACAINSAWDFRRDPRTALESHIYAIKRMGVVSVHDAKKVATVVAQAGRWVGPEGIIQFLCVGSETGTDVGRPVILFRDIADFLVTRFQPLLPLKIPERPEGLRTWGEFGYELTQFLKSHQDENLGSHIIREELEQAVGRYVHSGTPLYRPKS